MTSIPAQDQRLLKWLMFSAVSLAFFFLNMATFTSLGVVLFTMEAELHWSVAWAVFSFTFLGFACGLSSPLPGMTMRAWGARPTVCVGAGLLAIGFYLASISHSLLLFYIAMTLLGIGYSFAGNVPSVYLIAGWFQRRAPRMIGAYMMLGAAGAAVGPFIVERIVAQGGWRGHWNAMAWASIAIGLFCFAVIREARVSKTQTEPIRHRHVWRTARSRPFILVALVMSGTMACVTTNAAIGPNHLVKLGDNLEQAALVLSFIGAVATVLKAASGWLCELIKSTTVTAAGLVMQGVGVFIFAIAHSDFLQYLSALVFGVGWGLAYVAATVVLLDHFGRDMGSQLLSIVWFFVSVAGLGPFAAGWIADTYGTFAPVYVIYAIFMVLLAVPVLSLPRPAQSGLAPSRSNDASLTARAKAV
ncbi:MAG TPA: MFS transporter [Alphaproteobacteria bacterium]|nr:MFS transporter [Alphaproteobacteria bacterium]